MRVVSTLRPNGAQPEVGLEAQVAATTRERCGGFLREKVNLRTGEKQFVTGGLTADCFLVLAI